MRLLWVVILVACGGSAPASSGSPSHAAAPQRATPAVEDMAVKLGRAALAGQRVEALALTLTHAEISRISNKNQSKADWDQGVAQFLDQLSPEAAEGAAGGNKIEVVSAVGGVITAPLQQRAQRAQRARLSKRRRATARVVTAESGQTLASARLVAGASPATAHVRTSAAETVSDW